MLETDGDLDGSLFPHLASGEETGNEEKTCLDCLTVVCTQVFLHGLWVKRPQCLTVWLMVIAIVFLFFNSSISNYQCSLNKSGKRANKCKQVLHLKSDLMGENELK